ncbi:MAG: DUF5317 domain-containing protein [Actinobacteria bacterium]|nr:DUF5317 domain-containing protein [Actinomycetota bacterium]
MYFTAVAVVVGLALGFLTGGRLDHLAERRFRLPGLLVAGLVVQATSGWFGDGATVPLVLVSYVLLVVFCAANLAVVGMAVVLLGLSLNFLTIAVNGGMPVRRSAVVAAGIAEWHEVDELELHAKRHLERPDDDLMVISDIIPVPVIHEVLSFGDLVMSVGVADVLFRLLKPRPGARFKSDEDDTAAHHT